MACQILTRIKVAMKVLPKAEQNFPIITFEVDIKETVEDPNVIQLFNITESTENICLMMEHTEHQLPEEDKQSGQKGGRRASLPTIPLFCLNAPTPSIAPRKSLTYPPSPEQSSVGGMQRAASPPRLPGQKKAPSP
ncbi:Sperm motility kinase [Sciurus carolinensis]|uniref:Sperm motility kinase n=1 Tax=Sciurus carolinensis TaxID=30640 RepID=A0AA41N2E7_SCICA|nr:Sperm motility kinase [Sciurus carolinensis]